MATAQVIREAAPFSVVFPADLPAGVYLASVETKDGDGSSGGVIVTVDADYAVEGNAADASRIQYRQSSAPVSTPGEIVAQSVTLDGTDVFKAINHPTGRPDQIVYWWDANGTHRRVTANLDNGVTEDLVKTLVTGILAATNAG